MRHLTMAAALILTVTGGPLWAQASAEHNHPPVSSEAAPVQPAPGSAPAQPSPADPGQPSGQMHGSCCTMSSGSSKPGMMHRQIEDMMKGADMPGVKHDHE